jgi:hypothetical protein
LKTPRRSIYFRHAAEKQMEFLRIFDAPGVTECYQRKDSILPQQALALVNSELSERQARKLANTISVTVGTDPTAFATAAFERVLARLPGQAELNECVAFLAPASDEHSSGPRWETSESAGRSRESLVHVLMNHHDFVTIR